MASDQCSAPLAQPLSWHREAQLEIRSGDAVTVIEDDGRSTRTTATSAPWQLGHGGWVVRLEDRVGGWDLTRVHPDNQEDRP